MQTAYELAKKNYGKTWTIEQIQALIGRGKLTVDQYVEITRRPMDDLTPTIDFIIAHKLSELSQACEQTITEGIDVETTIGSEHFSLEYTDQLEINNKYNQIKEGAESVLYHSDGNTYRVFDAYEMKLISDSADKHIQYHRTYFNILKSYVTSLTSVDAVNDIIYGSKLPSELESKLNLLINNSTNTY